MLALGVGVCAYNLPQLIAGSVQFDGLDVHYAAQRYLSDELHGGRLPLWTPYVFSGFPFLADLQVGAWYPLNWPFLLAGIAPRSIGLELLVHDLIASLGAYALAQRLFGSSAPSVFAAVFYSLSGWFAAHSQHVGMFDTAAWLPWFLLLLWHIADGITARRLLLAGVLGAVVLLPGSFQIALYTFTFVGVWCACEAVARRSWSTARRFATGLAVAGVWGSLLAAIMILPALELATQSVRSQLNALDLPDIGYFHFGSLLTLADPDYYGLLSGHYFGPGDSTQHYFYAGILLLPLALIGARNRLVLRTAAFLGLPFLVYALGPRAGAYLLIARLPGFRSVELPMHGWFLVAMGLALLGGAGAAVLEQRVGQRWMAVLAVVLLVDVLTVNQVLNPLAYARAGVDSTGLNRLAAQAEAQSPVQRVYGPPLAQVGYRNHALQSRIATTYGYNPLELSAYADYAAAAQVNPRLIDGFAASHILVDDQGNLRPNPTALPLAYFAPSVTPDDDDHALATLDPHTTTLVSTPLPHVEQDPSATLSVTEDGLSSVTFHYQTRTPNLVRVAIPMYPGWSASLDTTELPLITVDHAFVGVLVPPGEGDVRLVYTPRLFWLAAAISAVAALGTITLAAAHVRRRP